MTDSTNKITKPFIDELAEFRDKLYAGPSTFRLPKGTVVDPKVAEYAKTKRIHITIDTREAESFNMEARYL